MLTVFLCYSSSFLYHATAQPWTKFFQTCDHVCIFLLIAGSYTPIVWRYCWRTRLRSIIVVWVLALAGIYVRIYTGYNTEFLYIAMGWGMILASLELLTRIFHKDMLLIVAGGLFYTAGAILEYMKMPTIMQGVIEHHEVWHLMVMSGTSMHYWFMWKELH
jgi:hemolysin III